MGLSLRSIGRSIADIWQADSEDDKKRRAAAGQPRLYADQKRQQRQQQNRVSYYRPQQQQVQKSAPSYGAGVSGFSNRVRDIFDSNSEQDYWRRNQEAEKKRSMGLEGFFDQSYREQQQSMGNARPWENFGSQVLGNTARFINTGKAAVDELADTSRLLTADLTNNDDAWKAANERIKARQQSQYQPDSGLLGAGTIFDNPEEFNSLGARDLTKRIGLNTLGAASEVVPFARVTRPAQVAGKTAQTLYKGGEPVANRALLAASKAERGASGLLPRIGFNAAIDTTTGAGESAARQYAQTGSIDPRVLAGDTAANLLLGQTQVAGGQFLKSRAGSKASKVVRDAVEDIPLTTSRSPRVLASKEAMETAFDAWDNQIKQGNKKNLASYKKSFEIARDEYIQATKAEKNFGMSTSKVEIPEDPSIKETYDRAKDVANSADTASQLSDAERTIKQLESEYPSLKETGVDPISGGRPEVGRGLKNTISKTDPFGNNKPLVRLKNELGRAFVDSDSEMINYFRRLEKQTGETGLADNWLFNTNTQRAAPSIANAKMRNSPEFKQAFAGLNSRQAKEFDTYLAARAELKNYEGLPTSRTKAQLQKTVDDLAPEYEKRFESFNRFTKEPLNDLLDSGIIDQKTYDKWINDNDYIRIQRNMDDLLGFEAGGGRSRSLGSTTTKQKRSGSSREVLSPSQTSIGRRQQLQLEIQRNKTASETIDVLQQAGVARQVPDAKNKNVVKRMVNGQPQYWEVPKDVKRVMDNVNPYQLGVLAKIVSTPARVFRAGTTALSAPFTVTNYLRDQASSAIYSKNVLATHAPQNVISGIASASRDFAGESQSPLWKKFEEFAGDQTIFDELRNAKASKRFLRETRRGKKGKAFNMATNPIRTLEDLNSITEKATRYQNFKGMYKNALKNKVPEEKALRDAVQAAYQNSVNFQRSGDVSRVLNMFIPYFNAGIQGSRNVARSFRDRPISTTAKSVGFIAAPTAAVTAINMGGVLNPDSPEIYDSIPDYEKRDNFIVILPGAKQGKDGRWTGIVKIPKPQGYRELTDPTREITEAFLSDKDRPSVAAMAKDMLGALTGPVNTEDVNKFASSFIPAIIKPTVQQQANKDFYTGSQIVPDFMVEGTDDPTKRAYKGTSGTAREIAKILGVEPVRVEKFVEDTFGSVGRYGLNASDNAIKTATGNEDFVVGGRSLKSDFSRRMFEAGGELLDKNKSPGQRYYESREKAIADVDLNKNELAAYTSLHPDKTNFLGEDIFDENKRVSKYTKAGTYLQFPKTFEVDKRVDAEQRARGNVGNPLFDLKGTQLNKVLLKQALPPGAKDEELDNLWKEDWYQDYRNATTKYYDSVKASLAKEGKKIPKSDNPYPDTPKGLQQIMDTYSALPKGTGDRSAWIKANPEAWKKMTDQWGAVDAWENKERVKLGLNPLVDDEESGTGYSKYSGYSKYGSSSKKRSVGSEYKYAISPNAGGDVKTPKVSVKTAPRKVIARRKQIKPKVSIKKIKI